MKKTRVFFMTLLVAITLFGFSGTSLAFELSDITAKPVQFFKYIVQKIGFGDDDEEKAQKAEAVETPSDKQSSADIPYYYINDTESVYLDLYPADLIIPLSSEWGTDKYEWLYYHEKISYNYENKEWYFRIGSRAGKSY
ncbi:MAG: hypothetical protein JXL81_02820, partial [Deltaproteobacteria bacterium]|nr:hypothetical protein [Deltaproteobacteria bacterium]